MVYVSGEAQFANFPGLNTGSRPAAYRSALVSGLSTIPAARSHSLFDAGGSAKSRHDSPRTPAASTEQTTKGALEPATLKLSGEQFFWRAPDGVGDSLGVSKCEFAVVPSVHC